MSEEQKPGDEPKAEATKRRRLSLGRKGLNLKQVRTLQRMTKVNTMAAAGEGIYSSRQATHRGVKRAFETAPEVLERLGITRDQILGKIASLHLSAYKRTLYGTVPDNGVQLRASVYLDKSFQARDEKAGAGGDTTTRNTVCVVVCNERAAGTLAGLFATRSTPSVVIDVDAEVDANAR